MKEQTLGLPSRTAASVPVSHPLTTSSTDCLHFTNDEEIILREGSSQSEASKSLTTGSFALGTVHKVTKLMVFLC